MASSKEYLQFVIEQLSGLEDITYKAMMGEYIIYYRGKIVGGIYDDWLMRRECKFLFRGTNFIDNQKRGMYEKKIS